MQGMRADCVAACRAYGTALRGRSDSVTLGRVRYVDVHGLFALLLALFGNLGKFEQCVGLSNLSLTKSKSTGIAIAKWVGI